MNYFKILYEKQKTFGSELEVQEKGLVAWPEVGARDRWNHILEQCCKVQITIEDADNETSN